MCAWLEKCAVTDVMKRRAEFKDVMACLKKADVRFGLLRPCKLILTFNDVTVTLTDPGKAQEHFNQVIKPTLQPQ